MSARPAPPTRADFVWWDRQTTRWNDNDIFGHMNNAVYFELMDTAVNNHLIAAFGRPVEELSAIGVVAEVSCRYLREMRYPGDVEIGISVTRVGTSSISYRVGLFQGEDEEARAEGRFVHVYVSNDDDHAVVRLPDEARAAATALLRS